MLGKGNRDRHLLLLDLPSLRQDDTFFGQNGQEEIHVSSRDSHTVCSKSGLGNLGKPAKHGEDRRRFDGRFILFVPIFIVPAQAVKIKLSTYLESRAAVG